MNFLLCALFMFCFPGPGWTTEAEEMTSLEVKITNMMDRMMKMESKLVVKDNEIAALKLDIERRDQSKNLEISELEKEMRLLVNQVRNPPFAFQCAYRHEWINDNSIITFDRLFYDSMSDGSSYNVSSGGLDITSGVFTVAPRFAGVWTVSPSMRLYSGGDNNVYLYKNGERIFESLIYSRRTGVEAIYSTGSRPIYLHLQARVQH